MFEIKLLNIKQLVSFWITFSYLTVLQNKIVYEAKQVVLLTT